MDEFTLIKSLQNPETDKKTKPPRGHKYDKFQVVVENETMTVLIPSRESEQFKVEISDVERFSSYDLKRILRKYRGLRG